MVTRQPNRAAVLLNLLRKETSVGKNLAFDVSVGTGVGTTYTDGEEVSAYSDDTELMASLGWGIYGDAFGITSLAESASASSRTEMANMIRKKTIDAVQRVAAKMNADLWSGDGTNQSFLGVTAAAGPFVATGEYAGVDRSTYPQWAGNLKTNGGNATQLTRNLVQEDLEAIYVASGTQPTFGVTSTKMWRKYANETDAKREIIQSVTIRGETIVLEGGWEAIEVNGIPVFRDKDCGDGDWAWVNADHTWIGQMPPNDRVRGKAVAMLPIAGTPEEQKGTDGKEPLMARLRQLPEQGDFSRFQLIAWCQLATDRCNANLLRRNLV